MRLHAFIRDADGPRPPRALVGQQLDDSVHDSMPRQIDQLAAAVQATCTPDQERAGKLGPAPDWEKMAVRLTAILD